MTIARAHRQDSLFEIAPKFSLQTSGERRVAFGSLAEHIVCAALGLDRIKINGSCAVNFDAERDGVFYEIKSCSVRGKIVAYKWRLEKEAPFKNLYYAILLHRVGSPVDSSDLLSAMLSRASILICPARLIRESADSGVHPLQIPKYDPARGKRFGYTRAGYVDGYYNLPIAELKAKAKVRLMIQAEIYDARQPIELLIV